MNITCSPHAVFLCKVEQMRRSLSYLFSISLQEQNLKVLDRCTPHHRFKTGNQTPVSSTRLHDLPAVGERWVGNESSVCGDWRRFTGSKLPSPLLLKTGQGWAKCLPGLLPTAHCYLAHGGSHCCASSLSLTTSVNKDLNNKQRHASLCVTESFTGLRFGPSAGHLNDTVKGSAQWPANFFSLASLDGTVADEWKAETCLWITGFGLGAKLEKRS